MDRDDIIGMLRLHEAELRAAGIVRLRLFGSSARGEATGASDVDLLALFDEGKRLSLLDVVHLENHLSDILGRKVDLVDELALKPRLRPHVERDVIHAF